MSTVNYKLRDNKFTYNWPVTLSSLEHIDAVYDFTNILYKTPPVTDKTSQDIE